ncbi:hypothetical protein [Nigerium massiliense]|uniref:hypothetical protein n=1 Tax=Nigerium massiliense TaxID=1522317 RepID=UPI00058CC4A1|nr:hypothetical protein [Nigerium massiliense]
MVVAERSHGPSGRRTSRWLRETANLLNSTTALGFVVARAGGARLRRGPEGLWFAQGYRPRLPSAGQFTVGNVVFTREPMDAVLRRRPGILAHESAHATQYAWFGTAFLPLYALASAWSWLLAGDPATRNPFEMGAGLVSGGYAGR